MHVFFRFVPSFENYRRHCFQVFGFEFFFDFICDRDELLLCSPLLERPLHLLRLFQQPFILAFEFFVVRRFEGIVFFSFELHYPLPDEVVELPADRLGRYKFSESLVCGFVEVDRYGLSRRRFSASFSPSLFPR